MPKMMIRVTILVIDQLESGKTNETSTHSYLRTRLLPKLKSSQDLTIRIETKVAEEAVDGITLGVDGGAQFLLNSCVLLKRVLDPSDPFHCSLCLVSPIMVLPLKEVIPVGVPCRGKGPYSAAEPR
jgi:hypothetical protein